MAFQGRHHNYFFLFDNQHGTMELVPSTDKEEDGFDDEYSSKNPSESYSQKKLGLWQGTALLTADCLGVGILALPFSIHILGWLPGLAFLVLQLPINYYAGYILAWTARQVEQECHDPTVRTTTGIDNEGDPSESALELTQMDPKIHRNKCDPIAHSESILNYEDHDQPVGLKSSTSAEDSDGKDVLEHAGVLEHDCNRKTHREQPDGLFRDSDVGDSSFNVPSSSDKVMPLEKLEQQQAPTQDLIGITSFVYDQYHLQDFWNSDSSAGPAPSHQHKVSTSVARPVVMLLYYLNLFLVLGDYILVMSHAVAAVWPMCITTAGLLASTLMFAICQLNTMALLGRYVSIASLLAMVVVLGQCIFSAQQPFDHSDESHTLNTTTFTGNDEPPRLLLDPFSRSLATAQAITAKDDTSLLRKFSALASICFAVGSQKLFLNVRYELQDRNHAAPVLARSLSLFGLAYVVVVVLAGPNPPPFLFDAIPEGTLNRKIAGLLLWGHVAVSYAINSQALCSSLDRLIFFAARSSTDRVRWIFLTLVLAISSYLVANGIPFFKDLVALIGAATSVPLTLTLPPVLYQHWQRLTRLRSRLAREAEGQEVVSMPSNTATRRGWDYVGTSALLLYSILFLGIGLAGALASVKRDWAASTSGPFACRHSG